MVEGLLIIFAIVQLVRNKIGSIFAIILCFFESYSFMGSSISEFLFTHNYSDVGLILMILLLISLMSRKHPLRKTSAIKGLKKSVLIFFAFYTVLIIVDLLANDVSVFSEIRMLRQWMCLILLWFLKYIKPSEVKSFLNYLLVISVGIALMFIFEYLTNSTITGAFRTLGKTRASVPWIISLLVFTLLLNNFYTIKSYIKWPCVAIIVGEMILTASRSLFIAYALSAVFVLFLYDSKVNLKKLLYLTILVGGIVFLFSSDNVLTKRFMNSREDLTSLSSGSSKVNGNFSFRVLLLQERIEYINKKLQYVVFGMGNIQEKDFHHKVFKIGVRWGNDLVQLDTGDIAWAVLILRLGYVGIFIYIGLFYFKFVWHNLKYRHRRGSFVSAIYLIINLLVVSLTYSHIATSFFWVAPILMLRFTLDDNRLMPRHKGSQRGKSESLTQPKLSTI